MSEHRFKVGQTVLFRVKGGNRNSIATGYRIVAQRPFDAGEHWYLVKSDLERHGRVAPESDLR